AGSTRATEQASNREPPKPANRLGGREPHRTNLGAVALPMTPGERVVTQEHAPALLLAGVTVVELERQRPVEGGRPGKSLVVTDHGACGDTHATADALDRQVDVAPLGGAA